MVKGKRDNIRVCGFPFAAHTTPSTYLGFLLQQCNVYRLLTVDVEFTQWVHYGKEPVSGQGGQCKNRDSYADVLGELGDSAQQGSVWPRLKYVHRGGQWDGCDNHQ